jgi:YVTN family beta-propeller protein
VFTGKSNTVHTRTSLIFPTGAINMPFDTEPHKGSDEVVLHTPGLYVFTCKIHPYMFGAVIIDDPTTQGLDLGEQISLVNGITVPTSSDLATRLLRTFFIATNPGNWEDYTSAAPWHITYPSVDVRITGGAIANLDAVLSARYGNDTAKDALFNPATAAVGEIWVDTQFEKTGGKSKPGTATAVSGQTWEPTRKVALPQINMNNPHNMWTDKNQNLIYQTQWFDSKLTVFNRTTGQLVNNITVGESPAHVMTQVGTDKLHVTLNGSTDHKSVVELSANAGGILRKIDIGEGNPHAHWMSHNGELMVTPNPFTNDSTEYNFTNDSKALLPTGALPIATGMTPDSTKAYVANLLDSTITVINTQTKNVVRTIDLLKIGVNYDPITGAVTGPVGALPIQTPVSPDGKSMVTANVLTGTITIVDPVTDTVVKMLPCDPGCHGVQYGAKQGGGYYAYVSSKFSNALIVVGFDASGSAASADIVGRIALTSVGTTAADDAISAYPSMGGQGILPIPVVYNGWVQNLPDSWKNQLTSAQRNPIQ